MDIAFRHARDASTVAVRRYWKYSTMGIELMTLYCVKSNLRPSREILLERQHRSELAIRKS
jgi:hypothetical protein